MLSTTIPDVVLPGELDDPHRKATRPLQANTSIVTVTYPTNRSPPRFPGAAPGQWRFPALAGLLAGYRQLFDQGGITELRFIALTPD